MSYILDALKKAERQRSKSPVPTLTTVQTPGAARRRPRRWPFVVVGLLVLNGAALFLLARRVSPPAPSPAPSAISAPVARARDQEVPAGSVSVGAEASRAEPSRAVPPESAAVNPPVPREPTRSAGERQRDARAAGRAPAVVAQSPTQSGAGTSTGSGDTSAPKKRIPAKPEAPGALPAAAAKPSAPAAGAAPPLLSELPPAFQQSLPRMRVEVHVYSDTPRERLVFINGAKYLEGQSVEGRIMVERIIPDGVVLSYDGQRFLLRR